MIGTVSFDMKRKPPESQSIKARKCALGLLGRRARSRKELSRHLLGRGYSEEIVRDLIEEFDRKSLTDDLRFSVDWIRWRMENRPRGRDYLRWELARKGVDKAVIKEALRSCEHMTDEATAIRKVLDTELNEKEASLKERQRLARRFMAHGFKPEIVREIVFDGLFCDGEEGL